MSSHNPRSYHEDFDPAEQLAAAEAEVHHAHLRDEIGRFLSPTEAMPDDLQEDFQGPADPLRPAPWDPNEITGWDHPWMWMNYDGYENEEGETDDDIPVEAEAAPVEVDDRYSRMAEEALVEDVLAAIRDRLALLEMERTTSGDAPSQAADIDLLDGAWDPRTQYEVMYGDMGDAPLDDAPSI